MNSRIAASLLATALAVVAAHDEEAERPGLPEIGAPAPSFRLNDHEGNAVSIGGTSGRWTVLAWYPKARTSGCTREVCSLRDAAADFEGLDVEVHGLSLDDVANQATFHEEQELNFPLLSDPDGSASAKYGVLPEGARWTRRVTVVIDPEGIVRHVAEKVDVTNHGADLVALVERLAAE
ncbi:MAG: peroxiredoxin [Planctomycetota bacterium JB042]